MLHQLLSDRTMCNTCTWDLKTECTVQKEVSLISVSHFFSSPHDFNQQFMPFIYDLINFALVVTMSMVVVVVIQV